jgi:Fur family ferric uptake transcriptional regulator
MQRLTHQRQAVIDAIAHSGQALSPQEILARAQAAAPSLNLSTVYRQIKALHDAQQVLRVDLPGQPARFEALCHAVQARKPDHHHHYFHCDDCDRVYPIHACPGKIDHLAPAGFEVWRHDLTLHGRCADCTARARGHEPRSSRTT